MTRFVACHPLVLAHAGTQFCAAVAYHGAVAASPKLGPRFREDEGVVGATPEMMRVHSAPPPLVCLLRKDTQATVSTNYAYRLECLVQGKYKKLSDNALIFPNTNLAIGALHQNWR